MHELESNWHTHSHNLSRQFKIKLFQSSPTAEENDVKVDMVVSGHYLPNLLNGELALIDFCPQSN